MDFPLRFAWKKDVHQWNLRQNQNPGMKQESIGRLPALTPAHGDVFYLRSHLCHDYCKGKRSFDDLKMYNGNIYSTFKEVCFEIGLLRDDSEWRRCLEEAYLESTARRMRALFATIIIFNRPADVNTLLFDFSDQLGEDISRDAQEYNILMEPETFVYSVVVLMERELESMDVAKDQIENIFGENFMIHEERAKVLELLEDIEEAKQQTNTIQTSTNPYQNLIPNHTLQELSDRISTLTEEQKEFIDDSEEIFGDSRQVSTSFHQCRCWNRQDIHNEHFCGTFIFTK